jgi:hypothetical protein
MEICHGLQCTIINGSVLLCTFDHRIVFQNSKNFSWLMIIFISQLYLLSACANTTPSEKLSDNLLISDTLLIPVIGNNEYVRIDDTGCLLLIKRRGVGVSLYDLKSNTILWEKENEELAYLGDPVQSIDIVEDNVFAIGYQFLSVFSLKNGELKFTQKLPKRLGSRPKNYSIFKTTINDDPYILTTYNIDENGWTKVDLLAMEKEDNASIRHFTILSLDTEETTTHVIGRYEPESNILTDDPKLPLDDQFYLVKDGTLYHAFTPEPKVWATNITLDDPKANEYYKLALDYPESSYFIPNSEKNNVHDIRSRLNQNMSLMGIFFDPNSKRFYIPYFRALFEWEQEIVDNPATTQSQVDLGFQRIRVAVFTQEFEKIAETALPANIHTLIGVVNDELYLKGYDEGENYDVIYKAIIKTDE